MFLPSHIDTDDLNGEGIIGLIDAIEKYNPDKGTEFPTYAMTRIRGSIIDSLRQKDWVPRNIREMEKDIEKAKSYLEHKNGRTPTLPELAEYMGLALQKLSYYLNKIKSAEVLSLEEIMRLSGPQGGNSTRTIGNGEPSIERQVEKKERQQILKNAISDLKPREKLILSLYYYEELSLKEIHQILGISMPRISQIHKNVLKKLRSALTPNEELMIS
jgi:RNA polymerase sigma factor for flagellar operon FliA